MSSKRRHPLPLIEFEYSEISEGWPHIPIMKIRGSYSNLGKAKDRCKILSKYDSSTNIFVAPVGKWVPSDGKIRNTDLEISYVQEQMQQLMKKKSENNVSNDLDFRKRTKTLKNKTSDKIDSNCNETISSSVIFDEATKDE